MLDFGPDFPPVRPESVYLRLVKECWRMIPQHVAGVHCSPLHNRANGVTGWIYSDNPVAAADAADQFRRRSTDVIRRVRGTPMAVVWQSVRFYIESMPHNPF
jgi:hypothetical protein